MNATTHHCIRIVCRATGLTPADLTGRCIARSVSRPRQVVMWLAYRHTRKSLTQIGRVLKRDHKAVLHGVRRIEARCDSNNAFRDLCVRLSRQVTA